MDIDSGKAVCVLGHHPWYERNLFGIEDMGETLNSDRPDAGIAENDLVLIKCSRIAFVCGANIFFSGLPDSCDGVEQFAYCAVAAFIHVAILAVIDHILEMHS